MSTRSSDVSRGQDRGPSTFDQVKRFGPSGVIALAAVLFVFQNTESVAFTFLWFDFTLPPWVMLLIFALVGAIVLWGVQRRRRSRQND